ncbi:hypothetical protein LG198_01280 [Methylobacillus arboreus]|uniref:hypothetical protein n=1 Tax=Methylobacillus arboreus TaxID=755170 RepID=UPI001E40CA80|nr:hypothetical protein [Methylobacillus arboreus]MCB5189361.1 hypothetical protein [Methylobacillus arboreus]
MKLVAVVLSIWLMAFQGQANANSYTDKKIFEEDAKQDILKEQSSREDIQFRGLLVTEFSDSLNLCGEVNKSGEPEWVRFVKIYDKETENLNSIWIEPGEALSEVEEFKKNQFENYWDRRCSSIR